MKSKVNGAPAVANDNESQTSNKQDNKKRKRKRKKKHKNKKKCPWKIGDQCRSVYTEDNLTYDAEIVDLDEEAETCIVRYRGYGNEEEKQFSELLQPTRKQKTRQKSDFESDSMDWSARQIPAPDKKKNSGSNNNHHFMPGMSFMPPFPGISMPQFSFPSFQPGFMGPPTGGLPFVPPPPPPMNDELLNGENESLCSMLMSWYMSGYHTGFYQGMKQTKRQRYTSTEPDSSR